MKTCTLLLGCLLAMAVQAQEAKRELWTWKDASGVTQYSDRPVPGAKKVELTGVTRASSPAASAPQSAQESAPQSSSAEEGAARPAAAAPVQYQALEFITPQDGESFFDADATVGVQLSSEPALADGHRLVVYMDGQEIGDGYDHLLSEPQRGTHTLTAVIFDEQANARIRSAPRVFHIKSPTSIAPRAVGPALKPKPTPN